MLLLRVRRLRQGTTELRLVRLVFLRALGDHHRGLDLVLLLLASQVVASGHRELLLLVLLLLATLVAAASGLMVLKLGTTVVRIQLLNSGWHPPREASPASHGHSLGLDLFCSLLMMLMLGGRELLCLVVLEVGLLVKAAVRDCDGGAPEIWLIVLGGRPTSERQAAVTIEMDSACPGNVPTESAATWTLKRPRLTGRGLLLGLIPWSLRLGDAAQPKPRQRVLDFLWLFGEGCCGGRRRGNSCQRR